MTADPSPYTILASEAPWVLDGMDLHVDYLFRPDKCPLEDDDPLDGWLPAIVSRGRIYPPYRAGDITPDPARTRLDALRYDVFCALARRLYGSVPCHRCNGTGDAEWLAHLTDGGSSVCPDCGGTGCRAHGEDVRYWFSQSPEVNAERIVEAVRQNTVRVG